MGILLNTLLSLDLLSISLTFSSAALSMVESSSSSLLDFFLAGLLDVANGSSMTRGKSELSPKTSERSVRGAEVF